MTDEEQLAQRSIATAKILRWAKNYSLGKLRVALKGLRPYGAYDWLEPDERDQLARIVEDEFSWRSKTGKANR